MNNTVWWNINETEIIRGKIEFIIEHMKAQMTPEDRELSLWTQDGGVVELSHQEFLRDLVFLEEQIKECNRNAARDTSVDHLSYGETLSPEER